MSKVIFIIGGDGFCGWPTSLYLSRRGYKVHVIDNLSRRKIDIDYNFNSLTPIKSIHERLKTWRDVSNNEIIFHNLDVAQSYQELLSLLKTYKPESIVHFGEQRAAPFSMKSALTNRYTVNNNVNGTNNILCAIVESKINTHLLHLGTMGVYGYGTTSFKIPEGYVDIIVQDESSQKIEKKNILYPSNPGSIYHMTKTLDQLMFQFYNKNYKLKITDLHQGIVWGTNTEETSLNPFLINRFDYDGDYGTVLNRFLVQAAIKHPLTVYGSGGQTRAFIHIKDTCQCIGIAIENPPLDSDKVRIFNQITEVYSVKDLATKVAEISGAEISFLSNPRKELGENDLFVSNDCFINLGLKPNLLSNQALIDEIELSKKYKDRCLKQNIPPMSYW